MFGYEVRFSSRLQGPISSGEIHRHAADYEADVAKAIAEEAEDTWLDRLDLSLRHQTPYYTTKIATRQLSATRYQVHDSGVVYGHWLEGTGSRNAPVTVFPGYHSLDYTKQVMKKQRKNIGRRILRQHRARGRLI